MSNSPPSSAPTEDKRHTTKHPFSHKSKSISTAELNSSDLNFLFFSQSPSFSTRSKRSVEPSTGGRSNHAFNCLGKACQWRPCGITAVESCTNWCEKSAVSLSNMLERSAVRVGARYGQRCPSAGRNARGDREWVRTGDTHSPLGQTK